MESNENFIKIENINDYKQIINKKYIHRVVQLENKCKIELCYPGMQMTEIHVNESLETIYNHL
jgi:hypothetical protein